MNDDIFNPQLLPGSVFLFGRERPGEQGKHWIALLHQTRMTMQTKR